MELMKNLKMKELVAWKRTYDIRHFRGCVKAGREVFFIYVRVHRSCFLVPFRQVSADAKLIWHAGLLGLDRDKKRRAEERTT